MLALRLSELKASNVECYEMALEQELTLYKTVETAISGGNL